MLMKSRSTNWHLERLNGVKKVAEEIIEAERYSVMKASIVREVIIRIEELLNLIKELEGEWEKWEEDDVKKAVSRILMELSAIKSIPVRDYHKDLWDLTRNAHSVVFDWVWLVDKKVNASRLIAEAEKAGLSLKVRDTELEIDGPEGNESTIQRLLGVEGEAIELLREKELGTMEAYSCDYQ